MKLRSYRAAAWWRCPSRLGQVEYRPAVSYVSRAVIHSKVTRRSHHGPPVVPPLGPPALWIQSLRPPTFLLLDYAAARSRGVCRTPETVEMGG